MANLIRKGTDKDEQGKAMQPVREHDPMRWFREMMRDPFREMLRWDPFREMFPSFGAQQQTFAPAFEVCEHKDRFVLSADMPGVKEQDLDIKLTGNRLTVSGKRESETEEKVDTYYAAERSYGMFTRSFTLPPDQVDLDHVTAELKNGVLTIVVPKRAGAQSRTIAIKGPTTQKS